MPHRSPYCCTTPLCRWLYSPSVSPSPSTAATGTTAYTACEGPTSSTNGVTNGLWLFQVGVGREVWGVSVDPIVLWSKLEPSFGCFAAQLFSVIIYCMHAPNVARNLAGPMPPFLSLPSPRHSPFLTQVKAQDEAGNISPPFNVTFRTDTTAPVITLAAPAATNHTNVGLTTLVSG